MKKARRTKKARVRGQGSVCLSPSKTTLKTLSTLLFIVRILSSLIQGGHGSVPFAYGSCMERFQRFLDNGSGGSSANRAFLCFRGLLHISWFENALVSETGGFSRASCSSWKSSVKQSTSSSFISETMSGRTLTTQFTSCIVQSSKPL